MAKRRSGKIAGSTITTAPKGGRGKKPKGIAGATIVNGFKPSRLVPTSG